MTGVVVLISGSGSNLQQLLDAAASGDLPAPIAAVISNRADAHGLERARRSGVPAIALPHGNYANREAYDAALQQEIDAHKPALVVLAGFMRILSEGFVQHYAGRMLNIHPSLLPAYRGLHTHQRVLAAGDSEHGCSVHFVTPDLDAGPLVMQARIPVLPDDTEHSLAARVQREEHRIYPRVIRWFLQGRLTLTQGVPRFDGRPLKEPVTVRPDAPLPA
ncbi:phosphoribosylglycinamide formyltransferase-1 [Natronocella acetinitrilica]|uniref:Phosphoribosylglycinamide formyltransferase n=1 Tax=Natronocella acetinitrilica TaxID=414046 RepID=A0AAE3KG86_9GAMM|nr:phosphoribosylglycinamide formyltransferase [Natronocella acetinitrilica]MCP1674962.1 phosphoribosylglycinamide formyltransferase-1 [Natronocella acetinitrilica]